MTSERDSTKKQRLHTHSVYVTFFTIKDKKGLCQAIMTPLPHSHVPCSCHNETVEKTAFLEADGKCPEARLPKSRGMRHT
jgi:hypothetical protein